MVGLVDFIVESNRIEGITRGASPAEIAAHEDFLDLDLIDVDAMEKFVDKVAFAPLRDRIGMDVRVGPHLPPPGGLGVRRALAGLLNAAYDGDLTPYEAHVEYETLHPFMDGNGRSGRVLWAWMMCREGNLAFSLPFLHRWYYQSLDGARNA